MSFIDANIIDQIKSINFENHEQYMVIIEFYRLAKNFVASRIPEFKEAFEEEERKDKFSP